MLWVRYSSLMTKIYDSIGKSYATHRQPDVRIAKLIETALGPSETVLNVGAGTDSYEPKSRKVTALEPSKEMIRQRPHNAAPVHQGYAETLPFRDTSFDAAMAVLTVHHWGDKAKGIAEMRRVARGPVIILTFDPAFGSFWLYDYFPKLVTLDKGRMPPLSAYAHWLGQVDITPVPIPADCTDGFLFAFWKRPHAYLDPKVRAGMSSFWKVGDLTDGLNRLEHDLKTGAWHTKNASLDHHDHYDFGYRLVVSK